MPGRRLPNYVNWKGQQAFAHPGLATGVRLYTFVLRGDLGALSHLCDHYLNDPSGGHVEIQPLGNNILLCFAIIDRLQSVVAPDKDMGWLPEIDNDDLRSCPGQQAGPYIPIPGQRMAWFVTLHPRRQRLGVHLRPRDLRVSCKGIGSFDFKKSDRDLTCMTARTLVFKKFDPTKKGKVRKLVKVCRTDKHAFGAPTHATANLDTAYSEILDAVGAQDAGIDVNDLSPFRDRTGLLHARFVFLKEFRHVSDPTLACYQAVTQTNLWPRNLVIHGRLPGSYRVTVGDYESHQIIQQLGLGGTSVVPLMTFYAEYDFLFDLGTELWKA